MVGNINSSTRKTHKSIFSCIFTWNSIMIGLPGISGWFQRTTWWWTKFYQICVKIAAFQLVRMLLWFSWFKSRCVVNKAWFGSWGEFQMSFGVVFLRKSSGTLITGSVVGLVCLCCRIVPASGVVAVWLHLLRLVLNYCAICTRFRQIGEYKRKRRIFRRC